ncbi:MAG TPA: hypothetical protein VGJ18_18615 [Gemmatimonadaceae bacterium]|jgi:nucleoside 2-deoxyribosyltransferase
MEEETITCAVCHKPVTLRATVGPRDAYRVECRRCVAYIIDGLADLSVRHFEPDKRQLLSGVLRNAAKHGALVTITPENVEELVTLAQPPRNPLEVVDRLLVDIAHEAENFSGKVEIPEEDWLSYYLATPPDLGAVIQQLRDLGYVAEFMEPVRGAGPGSRPGYLVRLSVGGWRRVQQLESTRTDSHQAFVAMAFADEMLSAFNDGIAPALNECGYRPLRVDSVEHNGKIDDLIIAEIRRSGLLVADFTKQRAGVYFEAGYAMGRGIPVIWCCRDDDFNNAHFDTRQYNHIKWATPAELREKLTNRIRASLPVTVQA